MNTVDKLKIEAYIKAIIGAADEIDNLKDEAAKRVTIGLIHCPHCGHSSVDVEEATRHDGCCEQHPMAIQCSALRAELKAAKEDAATARRDGAIEALEGLPCEYHYDTPCCDRSSTHKSQMCNRCRALAALKKEDQNG